MAKVADFYLGATHVEFYDDYVITDPVKLAEIQQYFVNKFLAR